MQWTLKKMATQFQTWKKNLWKNYVAVEEQDPEFTGPLEKLQHDWPAFVKLRKSEAVVARSEINKANAAKKTYHHTLGTVGYKTAVPKWEAFEAKLLDQGIIPQTADWPEMSSFGFSCMGQGCTHRQGRLLQRENGRKKLKK